MRNWVLGVAAGGLAALTASTSLAADAAWVLVPWESKIAYGSIKNGGTGESNYFAGLTGTVGADGAVLVDIDPGSVETHIDIRNERMQKWVFTPEAGAVRLATTVDMAALEKLGVGETMTTEVEGTVTLNRTEIDIDTALFVARLGEDRVLVTTDEMIMISAEDAGIEDGIAKLQEIAGLDSIARVAPVTLRLVFAEAPAGTPMLGAETLTVASAAESAPASTAETVVETAAETVAGSATAAATTATATATAAVTAATELVSTDPEAEPAPETVAAAAIPGDATKGKKVFNKCKACHVATEAKNKIGPNLHGVIGRAAAAVDGYKYSKAMRNSGITWTLDELTAYLKAPKKHVKGTKMAFGGLRKEKDRENVIAYLASVAP
ncbi:MAG: c-type cytochrome [Pseudomonadota bacterium]